MSRMLGNVVHEPFGDLAGLLRAVKIGGGDALLERRADTLLQQMGFVLPAEELQHQASGQDRAEGVGDSLPGDVRSRAVDRFEQRGATGMQVAGRSQAEATGK